jgi:epoxyqueuosine reductase
MFAAADLKRKAQELGFNLVGLTPAQPSPTLDAYLRWIERGMQADMHYLARPDRVERRTNLHSIVPDAQSIIMVGLDYRTGISSPDILDDPLRGRIASYAWGFDYHDIMTPRLEELAAWIQAQSGTAHQQRVYVDTGAVLERSHAQQAGMGFIGKNTMLIHPRRGSYFFLGEIITTLAIDHYDNTHRPTMCGSCSRCLQACPTDAFPQPYVLDARRCISYHTIENRGWIDHNLWQGFGNWVFGCDICQDVCPFQRFSSPASEELFTAIDADHCAPPLTSLLILDDDQFQQTYSGTPLERIGRAGLVRNACIAASNSRSKTLVPFLIQLLYDVEPVIRGHAAFALWKIQRMAALGTLTEMYYRETDQQVRAGLEAFMP